MASVVAQAEGSTRAADTAAWEEGSTVVALAEDTDRQETAITGTAGRNSRRPFFVLAFEAKKKNTFSRRTRLRRWAEGMAVKTRTNEASRRVSDSILAARAPRPL